MNGVNFIIAVVQREQSDSYMDFFHKHGANLVFSYLCEGTAQKKALHLWGLEKKERQIICCLCGASSAQTLLERLVSEMRIDAPNAGVAMMLPVRCVAGVSNAQCLSEGFLDDDFKKRVEDMQYSLIVAIAERGYVDMVMDAARDAGARGGTVIHAKGTGARFASKFFGLTIAEEKEMIYLVASKEGRDAIIDAIIEKAGPSTDARAIAFTVPVERVAGFSKL
ncbi:MAG: P-II family nitrogen regulator [bacterium]|nr:P-II family nitrogen regulator [bacterium]